MTATKSAKAPKKMGRPTKYSKLTADKIIEMIDSGLSEREIAKKKGMPDASTIRAWKDRHPDFLSRSVRAREASAELFNLERMKLNDWLMKQVKLAAESGMDIPKGVVEGAKVAMQELAREAAFRDDRNFGDRKKVALTGHDGGAVKVKEEVDLSGATLDALKQARELLYGNTKNSDTH